jgi:hypothetical protein
MAVTSQHAGSRNIEYRTPNLEFRTIGIAAAAFPRGSSFDISAFGGFDIRHFP